MQCLRIGADERDGAATQAGLFLATHSRDRTAVEAYITANDPSALGQQVDDRPRQQRLAGAGFSDDT